jgi:membrane-associated phospholipid phosphatase
MYEAVNAVVGRYNSYTGLPPDGQASMKAAIAQAAHDALAAMYPSQTPTFDTHLANDLASNNDDNKDEGVALGKNAAASILTLRKNDGSARPEPHVGVDIPETDGPGQWRPDPLNKNTTAVGYYWSQVTPFVLSSADQFRAPPPPDLASDAYAADFAEAASLGGDGVNTPTTRTDEQTQIGVFWAYDGRPSLCAPPKLYNELTMHIADLQGTSSDPMELSRLLVLVNVAMADAAIAVWESKWYYNFWRPVVSIRNTNPSVGGDLNWQPIGAPSSNAVAPNFTPPFPSYPSGHAGFGGALFQVLRDYYGTDDISFDFVSDEFNGTTTDNQGNPRPVVSRHYDSFSQAETENGRSRIYLGIHWNFDATNSIPLGNAVGDLVYNSL